MNKFNFLLALILTMSSFNLYADYDESKVLVELHNVFVDEGLNNIEDIKISQERLEYNVIDDLKSPFLAGDQDSPKVTFCQRITSGCIQYSCSLFLTDGKITRVGDCSVEFEIKPNI